MESALRWGRILGVKSPIGWQNTTEPSLVYAEGSRFPAAHPHLKMSKVTPPPPPLPLGYTYHWKIVVWRLARMENIGFTAQRAQVSGAPVNRKRCIHSEAKVLASLKYIYSFFAIISVWRDVTWPCLIYYLAVVHVLDNCNELNIFIFNSSYVAAMFRESRIAKRHSFEQNRRKPHIPIKINTKHVLNQFCVRMFYKPSFVPLKFIRIQHRFLN